MIYVCAELVGECPGDISRILELESEDQGFVDLAAAFEMVAAEIQDIESGIDPVCEAYYAQLKRQRSEIRARLRILLDA